MLVLDLILLRILLAGLLTGLLLWLFTQARRFFPASFSPRLRRVIWLTLLILSLLIIPLPVILNLPAETPDWLMALRLPDPQKSVLSFESIDKFFTDILPAGKTLSVKPGTWLSDQGYRQVLSFPDWIVNSLNNLRLFYFAGMLITLLVLIVKMIIGIMRRNSLAHQDLKPDQEAWQAEIARVRDQFGFYRQAEVVWADGDINRPWIIFDNWRRRWIPVPVADPKDMPVAERQEWLLSMLQRNAHPRLLLLGFFGFVRCLLWFNPFWHAAGRKIFADFATAKTQKSQVRKPVLAVIANVLMVLVIAPAFLLMLWQLPQNIILAHPTLDFQQTPQLNLSEVSETDWHQNIAKLDLLADSFALADADQGRYIWETYFFEIWGDENPGECIAIDSLNLSDGSWSVLAEFNRYKGQFDELTLKDNSIWQIHLDRNGQLISKTKVLGRSADQYADYEGSYENPYIPHATILNNGGCIIQKIKTTNSMLSANSSARISSNKDLTGYDVDGNIIFRLTDLDELLDNLNLELIYSHGNLNGTIFSVGLPSQIITLADDRWCMIDFKSTNWSHEDIQGNNQYVADNQYDQTVWVNCLNLQGETQWQKQVASGIEGAVLNTGAIHHDNMIYFSGIISGEARQQVTCISGFNTDDQTTWQITLDQFADYSVYDLIAQDGCLTLMMHGRSGQNLDQILFLQFSSDGRPLGIIKMAESEQMYYRLLAAEPGHVWYTQIEER